MYFHFVIIIIIVVIMCIIVAVIFISFGGCRQRNLHTVEVQALHFNAVQFMFAQYTKCMS